MSEWSATRGLTRRSVARLAVVAVVVLAALPATAAAAIAADGAGSTPATGTASSLPAEAEPTGSLEPTATPTPTSTPTPAPAQPTATPPATVAVTADGTTIDGESELPAANETDAAADAAGGAANATDGNGDAGSAHRSTGEVRTPDGPAGRSLTAGEAGPPAGGTATDTVAPTEPSLGVSADAGRATAGEALERDSAGPNPPADSAFGDLASTVAPVEDTADRVGALARTAGRAIDEATAIGTDALIAETRTTPARVDRTVGPVYGLAPDGVIGVPMATTFERSDRRLHGPTPPAEMNRPSAGRLDGADGPTVEGPRGGEPSAPGASAAALLALLAACVPFVRSSGTFAGLLSGAPGPSIRAQTEPVLRTLGDRLAVAFPGYSRYDDSDPLENDQRARLYEAVSRSPGRDLTTLVEETGLMRSTARYHLRILEHEGLVTPAKLWGNRRLYPADVDDLALAAALREEPTRATLEAVAGHEPASGATLAEALDRDPSTVTYHLTRLADAGLIERERDGRAVANRLSPAAREALATERAPDAAGPTPEPAD